MRLGQCREPHIFFVREKRDCYAVAQDGLLAPIKAGALTSVRAGAAHTGHSISCDRIAGLDQATRIRVTPHLALESTFI